MADRGIDIPSRLDELHLEVYEGMPERELDVNDIPGSVAAMREHSAQREIEPLPAGVTTEDRYAPGPDGAPDVLVRLYRPDGLEPGGPAFYWIHGGGMVVGSVDGNDGFCGQQALDLGILVASVEYRLAPEHPYPAPIEDCYAGLKWFAGAAGELGIDPARIAIGGGSAGGGLCAGLALLVRDRGEIDVCFQLLVYPMIDDRNISNSSHAITDPRLWNREKNLIGWGSYLAGNNGGDDVPVYAAPARATNLEGLPPAYINVGALDLFVDESIDYAQALNAAGVRTELHVYPVAFHGSPNSVSESPISQAWAADQQNALRSALFGDG